MKPLRFAQSLLVLAAAIALAAPAAAQGTFNPGGPKPKPPPSLADAYKPAAPAPRAPAAPAAPSPGGFKPYEPYKGASVYTPPKATPETDPCKTSVYSNACQKTKR